MAEDKPCISELYKSGGLDMELVVSMIILKSLKTMPMSSIPSCLSRTTVTAKSPPNSY